MRGCASIRPSHEVTMRTDTGKPVFLKDYRVPDYLIGTVNLDVKFHPSSTRVQAQLAIRPNPQGRPHAALGLDGDALTVSWIAFDRRILDLRDTAAWNGFVIPS